MNDCLDQIKDSLDKGVYPDILVKVTIELDNAGGLGLDYINKNSGTQDRSGGWNIQITK